jgi:TPR repeat protein
MAGDGVAKDMREAKYWINRARENGYSKADDVWEQSELWKC